MNNPMLHHWQFLLIVLSGIVSREHQRAIEYLRTENQVLKEKIGKKRIMLNDVQRRRLTVKEKILGRKRLKEIATIVTPDTILRWHRKLVASKWDYTQRCKSHGRPRLDQVIVDIVLRFTKENPEWGYDRIQAALANIGHSISDTSVGIAPRHTDSSPSRSASAKRPG